MFIEVIHKTPGNFVASIAESLTKRVDDLVGKVSDLEATLEFSQKDIKKTQNTD